MMCRSNFFSLTGGRDANHKSVGHICQAEQIRDQTESTPVVPFISVPDALHELGSGGPVYIQDSNEFGALIPAAYLELLLDIYAALLYL